jgi:hypothetical protein
MKKLVFAILCAAPIALALPHPSHAQAVKGMTVDQYMLMLERADAFCSYYAEGKPLPSAGQGLRIPTGGGLAYVFAPLEVQALMKHCRTLMELMQKARQ